MYSSQCLLHTVLFVGYQKYLFLEFQRTLETMTVCGLLFVGISKLMGKFPQLGIAKLNFGQVNHQSCERKSSSLSRDKPLIEFSKRR